MALLLVFVFIALFFSFLCSIAEAVILSVTPSYIESIRRQGNKSADRLRRFKENIDRPLAAILSLNTVAHTVGAAGAGAQAAVVFGSAYVGVISAVLTFMILIFTEIIPKTLGAVYWRQLAPMMSYLVLGLIISMAPLVWLSQKLAKVISGGRAKVVFTRDEFAAMAEIGARSGHLEDQESRILRNLLRFNSLRVKDIMTPRTVAMAMQENLTVAEIFQQEQEIPFSRIPIYRENLDDITGFVLKSDILLEQARDNHNKQLHELKRELYATPESASLSDLFDFLLDKRAHIVQVVDEYGGMEGIVTLEDVVETLVGLEIVDEADKNVDMQALARAQWKKRARALKLHEE